MRKLIMWDMVTLDGFFEGPNKGEIDWFLFEEDELQPYILESQMGAEMLLFGRVTYEGMAEYWQTAEGPIADFMNSIPKVVFSRTLETADWNNTRLVEDNAAAEVLQLKREGDGTIFVFGSADFSSTLMEAGLVDEYRLGINPLLLGAGTLFFKGSSKRVDLKLVEARPLKSGLVILHYQPARAHEEGDT